MSMDALDLPPEARDAVRAWLLLKCLEQERLSCYASTWTAWVRELAKELKPPPSAASTCPPDSTTGG